MMLRIPGLPFVPGNLIRDNSRIRYPRSQTLMTNQGVGMLNDRHKPIAAVQGGDVLDSNCPPVEAASLYPPKIGPLMPPWMVYDKKVLCFDAYCKQTLHEVYHAPYLVRKVKIYFFLEDDTIQIIEPKVDNSGMVQGCLVHRQRVPRPAPCDGEFMSLLDLNVDMTVRIFDRSYHITDCDKFTRQFLNVRGISVPDPVPQPEDPLEALRARKNNVVRQYPPPEKRHPFVQFLKFDRKILKFFGYWDDRTEFGDVRNLEICYYLCDDTMEIKENLPLNSGRDGQRVFLKRSRLAREFNGQPLPGQETPVTLLNVVGASMTNVRYCIDPLNTGATTTLYYSDRDLQIGTVLNIYGRDIVITDCDNFTKEFYRKKYAINDFTPLPTPVRAQECVSFNVEDRVLPPYNGWGTYEDSVGNCISVQPKPPGFNFKKFIKFDRYVLRFGAKMLSTIKENCERIFIISYFLSDDTVQVFEIAVRNSGFLGGEFQKRARIQLPGQVKFSTKPPIYYQAENFYIGATMCLKDFIFHIVSADEYTLVYMEHNAEEFPYANTTLIMEKIRKALTGRMRDFMSKCTLDMSNVMSEKNVLMNYESLKGALIAVMGNDISDHEIVTICRYYSAEKPPADDHCERNTVRAAAILEMKRSLWNGRDELIEHFHHINPTNKPYLEEAKIRSTMRGCRLPFSKELLDSVLKVLNRNECDEIEVCDLMGFIDMACENICDIAPMNVAFELCPKIPFLSKGRTINLSCFLLDLGLKFDEDAASPPPATNED